MQTQPNISASDLGNFGQTAIMAAVAHMEIAQSIMLCNSARDVARLLEHKKIAPTMIRLLKDVQSWTSKDTKNKNRRNQFSGMIEHAQSRMRECTHNPKGNQVRELPQILRALVLSPYSEKEIAGLLFLGPILGQFTKLNTRDCEGSRGAFYTSPPPFHFGMWRHEQESLRVDISLTTPNHQSLKKAFAMLQFLDRFKYTKGCEIFHNEQLSGYSTYIQMSPEELKWINDHPPEHDQVQEQHLNRTRTHSEINEPYKTPKGYLTQTPIWSTRYGPQIAPGDEFTPATASMYLGFDGAFYKFIQRADLHNLFFQLAH